MTYIVSFAVIAALVSPVMWREVPPEESIYWLDEVFFKVIGGCVLVASAMFCAAAIWCEG
jgi:hypothetical protein